MKLSAKHQQAVESKDAAQRECLAYHHILQAIVGDSGKWGTLQRVGSVYERGDSWVWQIAFSPRMRDAVVMETFDSAINGGKTVRCFFLADVTPIYANRSLESTSLPGKFQALYWHAVEMERVEQNRSAA